MRTLAVSVAALLVLVVVSPAFAQPFADVPTDHWAFDAIAELAAKGIIEGFPDGTFKGDRGVTRYEVAMIVARILARIEAIKIPAPAAAAPAPQVTRADVQTIQRLVNEFRAELAALGVRVTAVEEELTAIKGATSATKVSGDMYYRYVMPASVGGIGGSGSWSQALLTFTGKASDATAVVRLAVGTDGEVADFGASSATGWIEPVTFDRAYLDFGYYGLKWRIGRQTYTLGPVGLLFNEGWVLCGSGFLNQGGCGGVDGGVVSGTLGPVGFEVASFVINQGAGFAPFPAPVVSAVNANASMARVTFDLSGWTIGANYYREVFNAGSPTDNGWSADLSGDIFPGINLEGEYASFTPSAGAAINAYQATASMDLGSMMGMGSTKLSVWYKNFPVGWGLKGAVTFGSALLMPGSSEMIGSSIVDDLNVWGARVSMTLSPQLRPYIGYETGTRSSGNYTEYEVGIRSQISTNVDARVRYQHRENPAPTITRDRYRFEVFYSW